jgi:hypothetical protein
MTDAATPIPREATAPITPTFGRLPPWARPREAQASDGGRTRRVETIVLLLVALLLSIATVNDVVLATHTNHRLVADLQTWRTYTGHEYHSVSVEPDVRHHTTRDVVCGNTSPGAPGERIQFCLQLSGPVVHGRRATQGGWYLPARTQNLPADRYGCFGIAKTQGACSK